MFSPQISFGKKRSKYIENIMNAMNKNLSDKREELYTAINIEFQDYVLYKKTCEILEMIIEAERKFSNSINIKRVSQSYKLKQEIISNEDVFPEDC